MTAALPQASDDVLVVTEGEPRARERLRRALEHLNFDVTVSSSVAEAERAMRQRSPGLIFVEFKLFRPWTSQQDRRIPTVVLTHNRPTAAQHRAAIEGGALLVLDANVAAEADILGHYVMLLSRRLGIHHAIRAAGDRDLTIASTFSLGAPGLQDTNGRIDAQEVAAYLDVPLKQLAEGLGGNYAAIHKTPTSDAVQELMRPVFDIVAMLRRVFAGDDVKVRQWLRAPRAELRAQSPLDTMLQPNQIRAVSALVSQAWLGIPD